MHRRCNVAALFSKSHQPSLQAPHCGHTCSMKETEHVLGSQLSVHYLTNFASSSFNHLVTGHFKIPVSISSACVGYHLTGRIPCLPFKSGMGIVHWKKNQAHMHASLVNCNKMFVILTIPFVIGVARYRYWHGFKLCHPLRPE